MKIFLFIILGTLHILLNFGKLFFIKIGGYIKDYDLYEKRDNIKYLIKVENNISDDYDDKYLKTKINSEDERKATCCNNRNDLLYLRFTLKI